MGRASSSPARRRAPTYRSGAIELAERDPVIAALVAEVGLPRIPRPVDGPFAALVRSVTHQQLAGAAARAIHGRLTDLLEGDITPERVLAASSEDLRAAGLSANKMACLRDLATKVEDGTVHLDSRRLSREPDEEFITRLTTVRGIGRWSAEIFLMFQLRRLDVWPTGDLGVRKGFGLAWGLPMPTPKQLQELGEPYHPYRSVVAWYCWRAANLYGTTARSAVTG